MICPERTTPSGLAPPWRKGDHGFTLIEVLIALIIFGIAFGAIAGIFQTGLSQSSSAQTLQSAQALAEQQIARLGRDLPLMPGEQSGLSAPGLAWHSEIALTAPVEDGSDLALYRVTVNVGAPESERSYVTLTTLRIGSAP